MKRSTFRWVHIVFGVPIIGYIHSPFKEPPNYAPLVGMWPFLSLSLRTFDVESPYVEKISLRRHNNKKEPI